MRTSGQLAAEGTAPAPFFRQECKDLGSLGPGQASQNCCKTAALLCSGQGSPRALRVSVPGLPPGSVHSSRESTWTFPGGGTLAALCARGPRTAFSGHRPSSLCHPSLARQGFFTPGFLRRAPRVPVAAEAWHPQVAPAPPSRSSLFCTGAPTRPSSCQLAGLTCPLPVLILSPPLGRILFSCPPPTG